MIEAAQCLLTNAETHRHTEHLDTRIRTNRNPKPPSAVVNVFSGTSKHTQKTDDCSTLVYQEHKHETQILNRTSPRSPRNPSEHNTPHLFPHAHVWYTPFQREITFNEPSKSDTDTSRRVRSNPIERRHKAIHNVLDGTRTEPQPNHMQHCVLNLLAHCDHFLETLRKHNNMKFTRQTQLINDILLATRRILFRN